MYIGYIELYRPASTQAHVIDGRVIESVSKKMDRLQIPRGFSMRPVLIHAGEVAEAVVQSRFFARIIPFERFMKGAAAATRGAQ